MTILNHFKFDAVILVPLIWMIILIKKFNFNKDVESTHTGLRLWGEWICEARRNHQQSSLVSFFFLCCLHPTLINQCNCNCNCNGASSGFSFYHKMKSLVGYLSRNPHSWSFQYYLQKSKWRWMWDAGLQLPRLQRLWDHPWARLWQVPTKGEVRKNENLILASCYLWYLIPLNTQHL